MCDPAEPTDCLMTTLADAVGAPSTVAFWLAIAFVTAALVLMILAGVTIYRSRASRESGIGEVREGALQPLAAAGVPRQERASDDAIGTPQEAGWIEAVVDAADRGQGLAQRAGGVRQDDGFARRRFGP